jgi:hypothetical protein
MVSLFGDVPFVRNPLTAMRYPPNWLNLLLPVDLANRRLLAIQFFVAGLYCRGLFPTCIPGICRCFFSGIGFVVPLCGTRDGG